MKPATARHPSHDAACPHCGEPFKAARFFGRPMGDYGCARCGQRFSIAWGRFYGANAEPLPAWVGDPLPGDAR